MDHLKFILRRNIVWTWLFIKPFLNNFYTPKINALNISKREAFTKLPSSGSIWFQIQNKLQQIFTAKYTSCNLKIVFVSPIRVKSFFKFMDKLPMMPCAELVYRYKCGGCNATHSGLYEHLWILHLSGKKVKIDNNKLSVLCRTEFI